MSFNLTALGNPRAQPASSSPPVWPPAPTDSLFQPPFTQPDPQRYQAVMFLTARVQGLQAEVAYLEQQKPTSSWAVRGSIEALINTKKTELDVMKYALGAVGFTLPHENVVEKKPNQSDWSTGGVLF